MEGFFDSLRIEYADNGVGAVMIYPGWVSTIISSRAGCWIWLGHAPALQLEAVIY